MIEDKLIELKKKYGEYLKECIGRLKEEPNYKSLHREFKLHTLLNDNNKFKLGQIEFIVNFSEVIDILDSYSELNLVDKSLEDIDKISDGINAVYNYLEYLNFNCFPSDVR